MKTITLAYVIFMITFLSIIKPKKSTKSTIKVQGGPSGFEPSQLDPQGKHFCLIQDDLYAIKIKSYSRFQQNVRQSVRKIKNLVGLSK